MNISNEERRILIKHRLEKSHNIYDDAIFNFDAERYSTAANRLYYALFHSCGALLLSIGIESNRHSGLRAMISQHFILKGLLTPQDGKLLHNLFMLRQQSDYDDFISIDKEEVEIYINPVKELIKKISELLKSNLGNQD